MALSGREIFLVLRARDEATRTLNRISRGLNAAQRAAHASHSEAVRQHDKQIRMLQSQGRQAKQMYQSSIEKINANRDALRNERNDLQLRGRALRDDHRQTMSMLTDQRTAIKREYEDRKKAIRQQMEGASDARRRGLERAMRDLDATHSVAVRGWEDEKRAAQKSVADQINALNDLGRANQARTNAFATDQLKLRNAHQATLRQLEMQKVRTQELMRLEQERVKRLERIQQVNMERGQGLMNMGGALTTGGTVAAFGGAVALGALKQNVDAYRAYRQEVVKTRTQVDATRKGMINLGKAGMDVGREIPVAFEEIQPMLYDIFSSMDVTGKGARKMLRQIAKDAVGGATSMEKAGRAEIAILNAYGMKAEDVTDVSDFMFQLVRKGVGTFEEFASTIGRAVPSAARSGQSVQELGGMLAFLTRNGLSAAMASASAGRAFDAMSHPKTVAKMEKLGIAVKDASGEFRPMSEIIVDMREKFDEMTAPERAKALYNLFKSSGGTIQARRFYDAVLKSDSAVADYTKRVKEMNNAHGVAKEAFDRLKQTPEAQIQLFKNRVQALQIQMGRFLMPIMLDVIGAISRMLDWWEKLDPSMRRVITRTLAAIAALVLLAGILAALTGAFMMLRGTALLIGKSMAYLIGSFGLVGVAIGIVAFAVYEIFKHWDKIKPYFEAIKDAVLGPLNDVKDWMSRQWDNIWANIGGPITRAKDTISAVWEALSYGLIDDSDKARKGVQGKYADMGLTAVDKTSEAAQKIKAKWAELTGWFDRNLGFGDAFDSIKSALGDAWDELLQAATDSWNDFKKAIDVEGIKKDWRSLRREWDKLTGDLEDSQGDIQAAGQAIGLAIRIWSKYVGTMMRVIGITIGTGLDTVLKLVVNFVHAFVQIFRGWLLLIRGLLRVYRGAWHRDWSEMFEGVKMMAHGFGLIIAGVFRALFGTLLKLVEGKLKLIGHLFSMMVDRVSGKTGVVPAMKESVIQSFRDMYHGANQWTGEMVGKVISKMTDLKNWLNGPFTNGANIFVKGIAKIFSGLIDAFLHPVKTLVGIYNSMLVPLINGAAKFFGSGVRLSTISTGGGGGKGKGAGAGRAGSGQGQKDNPNSFYKGGIAPGYTPGRDVMTAAVSGGEAIMRPEWTRAVGAAEIHRWNHIAAKSGVRGVKRAMEGGFAGAFAKGGVVWPTTFKSLSQSYPGHTGVDISIPGTADYGKPVFATAAGIARIVNSGNASYGLHEIINHGSYQTIYGHLSRAFASGPVRAGQQIGNIGSTGNSTGPHLHFEIRPGGTWAAALSYLRGAGIPSGGQGTLGGLSIPIPDFLSKLGNVVGKIKDIGGSPVAGLIRDGGLKVTGMAKDWLTSKVASFNPIGLAQGAAGALSGAAGGLFGKASNIAGKMFGWGGNQLAALKTLVAKESSWNPRAQNPTSSAFGLFQFLDSTWGSVGMRKTANPIQQIVGGLRYIRQRYGSPGAALAFHNSHNWYDSGGWLKSGDIGGNSSGKPEPVFSHGQWQTMKHGARVLQDIGGPTLRVKKSGTDTSASGAGIVRDVKNEKDVTKEEEKQAEATKKKAAAAKRHARLIKSVQNMLKKMNGLKPKGVMKIAQDAFNKKITAKQATRISTRFQGRADKLDDSGGNIKKRIAAARKNVAELKAAREESMTQLRDSYKEYGTLANVAGHEDLFGNQMAVNAANIVSNIGTRLKNVQTFSKGLKDLQKMGYSRAIIQQVIAMGPDEGAEYVKALVAATPTERKAINEGLAKFGSEGNEIAKWVGNNMYDAGIKAGQGLINGLKRKETEITKAARSLATAIVRELRQVLQIKSPSRIAIAISDNFGGTLARGLSGWVGSVNRASNELGRAAIPSTLGGPVGGGSAGPASVTEINQDITIHTQEIDPRRHGQQLGWQLATRFTGS